MSPDDQDLYSDNQAWKPVIARWRWQGCIRCGSKEVRRYDYRDGRFLVVCNDCGHVWDAYGQTLIPARPTEYRMSEAQFVVIMITGMILGAVVVGPTAAALYVGAIISFFIGLVVVLTQNLGFRGQMHAWIRQVQALRGPKWPPAVAATDQLAGSGKSPLLACLLSLVVLGGGGQLYLGQTAKGLSLMAATIVSSLFEESPLLEALLYYHNALFNVVGAIDAYGIARAIQSGQDVGPWGFRLTLRGTLVTVAIIAVVAVGYTMLAIATAL